MKPPKPEGDLDRVERITFALPHPERVTLDRLARENDLSLAQLCRRGVRQVAAELERQEPASA